MSGNNDWGAKRSKYLPRHAETIVVTYADGKHVLHGRANGEVIRLKDTAANRNRRFDKPAKPKDTQWRSAGSGVVYEPAKGSSRRQYRGKQYNRIATNMWADVRDASLETFAPIVRKGK